MGEENKGGKGVRCRQPKEYFGSKMATNFL